MGLGDNSERDLRGGGGGGGVGLSDKGLDGLW